jgi:hypothetical protein
MRTTRRPQRTVRSDHWSGQAATRAGCRRVLSVTDIARALFCAGLLGTTVFLGAARAEAAPVSFSLTWDAPPACPDAAYLRAQVETLLAGAPSLLARVVARTEVSQRDDGSAGRPNGIARGRARRKVYMLRFGIGVGSAPFPGHPLPPNRTGGFPASGSPVSGLFAETDALMPWLWSS